MSRLRSKKYREAKKAASEKRREGYVRTFIEKNDLHPDVAKRMSPKKVRLLKIKKDIEKGRSLRDEERYYRVLDDAKLLAIVPDDFEYCVPSVESEDKKVLYRDGLVSALSEFEGKEVGENFLDDRIRLYMSEAIDSGMIIPVKATPGTLPRLRLLRNGDVMVMSPGELDYDYIMEQFGIRKENSDVTECKTG